MTGANSISPRREMRRSDRPKLLRHIGPKRAAPKASYLSLIRGAGITAARAFQPNTIAVLVAILFGACKSGFAGRVFCTRHTNPILKAVVRSPRADPPVSRRSPHVQARRQATRSRQGAVLAGDDPAAAAQR